MCQLMNYEDGIVDFETVICIENHLLCSLDFMKCFHIHVLISFIIILLGSYHNYYH